MQSYPIINKQTLLNNCQPYLQDVTEVTEQPLPAEMATGSEKAGSNAVLSHHKQTVLNKLSALAGFDVGNGAAASGGDGNGLREEGRF